MPKTLGNFRLGNTTLSYGNYDRMSILLTLLT